MVPAGIGAGITTVMVSAGAALKDGTAGGIDAAYRRGLVSTRAMPSPSGASGPAIASPQVRFSGETCLKLPQVALQGHSRTKPMRRANLPSFRLSSSARLRPAP
jgi:hypothetical protein